MLQAYIDDSAKGDPDLFVLAGYVSTVDRWKRFLDEWQRLLDMKSPHYRQLEYFKMSEMGSERDRERCAWFHKVIEDHALAAISYTISTKELKRWARRIFPHDRRFQRGVASPWHYAVGAMLWMYAENRPNIGLPDGPIDFIFDESLHEKAVVIQAWDRFKELNPKQAPLMGSTPAFKDDKEYLPLQAADMFAWWIRHWQLDGLKGEQIYQCEYPWPHNRQDMPWTHILTNKNHIRAKLREIRTAKGDFVGGIVPPRLWPP